MVEYVAQEDVDFQMGSSLFKDLTAACRDVLGLVEALGDAPSRVKIERAIVGSSFYEDLRGIISKHLGYDLSTLYILRTSYPIAGILNTIKGKYKFDVDHDLRKLATGLTDKASPSFRVKEGFSKISNTLDEDTGRIDETVKNKVVARLAISTGMFTFLDALGVRMTAEEFAALILHEIGHVVDTAHICGWFYYRSLIVRNVLDTFDTNTISQSELKEIVTILKAQTVDFPKTDDTHRLLSALDKASDVLSSGVISPNQLEKVEQAVKVATASVMATLVANRDARVIEKYSDVVVTKNNNAYRERTADTFAVKYMAGPHLVSILKKLAAYTEGATQMEAYPRANPLAQLCVFWNNAAVSMRAALDMSACDISDGYDGVLNRLRKAVETQKQIFRKDIPQDLQDVYIAEVKAMEAEIDTYYSQKHVRVRESVYKTLTSFFSIVSSAFSLGSSSTIEKDYRALFDLTETLIKNPLHYELARARRLLTK